MLEAAHLEHMALSKEIGKMRSDMKVVRGKLSEIVREVTKTAETADTLRNETEKSRKRLTELQREYLEDIRSKCDEKIEENDFFLKGRPKIALCFHDAFDRFVGSKQELEEAREKIEQYHDKIKETLCDQCNDSIDEEWHKLVVHESAIVDCDSDDVSSSSRVLLLSKLVPFEA